MLKLKGKPVETSATVRKRVQYARERQAERQGCLNGHLDNRELERVCRLETQIEAQLAGAVDKLRLSARSYHKLLKLARSIADLEGSQCVRSEDLSEALGYRSMNDQLPVM